MWVRTRVPRQDSASEKIIFRFEVKLLSGPVTTAFVTKYPEAPSRIIDIRGSQTLELLHEIIFRAFDREDNHMYEFQIGGEEPMDEKAVRYGIVPDYSDPKEKSVKETTIAALNLKTGSLFFYWFDFGDDWWHEVRLLAVDPQEKSRKRYPRIVERKGESPPQYVDWEEEENAEKRRLDEIFALIKDFCASHLTEGYLSACEQLLEAAYGEFLPLERGKAASWAAGVVHAAGTINFLQDPASEPHMKLRDIAQHFGVSPATMENKSREIRDGLKTFPMDPRFSASEHLE